MGDCTLSDICVPVDNILRRTFVDRDFRVDNSACCLTIGSCKSDPHIWHDCADERTSNPLSSFLTICRPGPFSLSIAHNTGGTAHSIYAMEQLVSSSYSLRAVQSSATHSDRRLGDEEISQIHYNFQGERHIQSRSHNFLLLRHV